jgi:hypothetical protein
MLNNSSAKNSSAKFIDLVLEGDAFETEIDDFVEEWHNGESDLSLTEFLGFTKEEYALWVEQPQSLRSILFCRKNEINVEEVSEWQEAHRLAARSQGLGDPDTLLNWLKKTGRLE